MRTALAIPALLCAIAPLTGAEERSILFIGNSLTFVNNLPATLAGLAEAGGAGPLIHEQVTVGGATLAKHWRTGTALERIRSRRWTWVVLQEQSVGTYADPESFNTHARRFIEAIVANGSQPVLYATWSRLGEIATQDSITAAYAEAARPHGVLIPVGEAFRSYRAGHGDGSLFTDNRHPNPAGTYLAACCFYRVLFSADPCRLPAGAGKLAAEQRSELQTLARDTIALSANATPHLR